ncbi:hypothetical protein PybrP1_010372 [[Pythium] brassicae (nom. inval.)]|nr:hypothetical protein PybrP1_010372 [[Pythium] brassicae (nom. inval.)]
MLLEAGLRKDDENKAARRWSASTPSLSYEQWLKRLGVGLFSIWVVFALFYVSHSNSTRPPLRAADAQQAADGDGDRQRTIESAFPEETNFLVIGDYGTGSADQVATAEAMKHFAASLEPRPAFVLSTGDQIYEHGITSASDPLLKERFEQMYDHPDLNVPWYITIGNHDCEGSIDAMLQYAAQKDAKWFFPRRYYTLDRPVAPRTILRLVVLDACDLVCGHEPRNVRCNAAMNAQTSAASRLEQYRWADAVLGAGRPAGVERMWTVVVGHWGVYSFAGNAHTPELIASLDPLLAKHKVHAYFSGHDHCLQHVTIASGAGRPPRHYFVSGAGGYRVHTLAPKARESPDLVHAAMTHGFMWVKVTRTRFQVQFVDKAGEVLYTAEVQYENQ